MDKQLLLDKLEGAAVMCNFYDNEYGGDDRIQKARMWGNRLSDILNDLWELDPDCVSGAISDVKFNTGYHIIYP